MRADRGPKLLLLNTPHNPTGMVFTRAELELVAELCREHHVLAVCDEVYDRMSSKTWVRYIHQKRRCV